MNLGAGRDDVDLLAAPQHADMCGGVRQIEQGIERAVRALLAPDVGDIGRQTGGVFDRVHRLGRQRAVTCPPGENRLGRPLRFMAKDDAHASRLANDAPFWLHVPPGDIGDGGTHADAADLLIMR